MITGYRIQVRGVTEQSLQSGYKMYRRRWRSRRRRRGRRRRRMRRHWPVTASQKDSSYQYRKYVINCRPIADLRIVFQTYLITFNACLTICIHCVYDEIVPEIRIYKDVTSPLFRKYLARIVVYYISYTIHYSLCLRKVLYNKTIHMFWIRKNCRFLNLFITTL